MTMRITRGLFFITLVGACSGGESKTTAGDAGDQTDGSADAAVTFYQHVKPLLAEHCGQCHVAGGIAPFVFDDYQRTAALAEAIAEVTQKRTMPPWLPADGCAKLSGSRALSAEDIALLQAWAKAGAPAGPAQPDHDTMPHPHSVTVTQRHEVRIEVPQDILGPPEVTLVPPAVYTPPPRQDDFRCHALDPQLREERHLIGYDIKPQNLQIVHHVLLFSVDDEDFAKAKDLDAKDAGPGYRCFGQGGLKTSFLGAWVPGTTLTKLPDTVGIPLKAGSGIIMQIHYNTVFTPDGSDRTTADLHFSEQPVANVARVVAVANTTFRIQPGEKAATVTKELNVPRMARIWGTAPHMHFLGTEIKVEVLPPQAALQCAVDIPRWDYHWQQFYFFEQPLVVAAGAKVRLTCTFDNSAENQPIVNGAPQTPKDVGWGEGTLDEMCLTYLLMTAP